MTVTKTYEETLDAFLKYVGVVQDRMDDRYKDGPYELYGILFDEGPKRWKLIQTMGQSRSVHSFVDKKTGDILKPASWNAPAKHARGNIFDADHGASALNGYHVRYLK